MNVRFLLNRHDGDSIVEAAAGQRRHLGDLARLLDDGGVARTGFVGGETSQQWWGRFEALHPDAAARLVAATPAATTLEDLLCVRGKDGSEPMEVDYAGGAAEVCDGVEAWYADESAVRAALATGHRLRSLSDGAAIAEFCRLAGGGYAHEREGLPFAARYADALFDLSTEDGRADALDRVFQGREGDLADAMMWLDAQREGVVLP